MNNQLRPYVLKKFTKEQDKQLVECVARYPPIYNWQNKDYKLLYIREAIWKEISDLVGRNSKYYKC